MRYLAKDAQNLETASVLETSLLRTIVEGLGFNLVELVVSRHRGSVQIRVVIYNGKSIGTDDCSKVHRSIMPRLELAFPQQDIYLEVSSGGIDRLIKNGEEFAYYIGRGVRCYRTDISDWMRGFLESADENGIKIRTNEGTVSLNFDIIAKARLDPSQEV